MSQTIYGDLYHLSENDRIAMIGNSASGGMLVGFVVETDEKADRYLAKLAKRFPLVQLVDRGPGPVPDTVLVRIQLSPAGMS